jgi:hypothetical protein
MPEIDQKAAIIVPGELSKLAFANGNLECKKVLCRHFSVFFESGKDLFQTVSVL